MCNGRTLSTCRERYPLTSRFWCDVCYAAFLLEEQEAARRAREVAKATDEEWLSHLGAVVPRAVAYVEG